MRRVTCNIAIAVFSLAAAAHTLAQPGRGALVPWKIIQPGRVEAAPLTLYWIPATRGEMRRSPLLASDELTLYSSRCVLMRVVRIDDRARLTQLAGGEELPLVALVDQAGEIVGKVTAEAGDINLSSVERLVRLELERRGAAADALLDSARSKADEGDIDAATALYREVADARCTCPRQAKDATRALRKLRVAVRH